MESKSKIYALLCVLAVMCGIYFFKSADMAVVTDNTAIIENEIENAGGYGQLYLRIVGADEKNSPDILINGVSAGKITGETKILDIFDKCVVELDTRKTVAAVLVQIEGKSENVVTDCVGRTVTGNGDIQNVGTFILQ